MTSNTKRVALNTIAFFFARVIDVLAGILTVVLIARYLGVQEFGDYAFITTLVGFLVSITYFGLERVAIREIARNRENADETLGGILVVRWALSFLVIIVMAGYLLLSSLPGPFIAAMIIATVSELIWASGSVFSCTFKAFEKMHLETATTFVFRLTSLALIGAVVYFRGAMILLFGAACIANIIRSVLAIYYSRTLSVKPLVKVNYSLWKTYTAEAFILGIVVVLALGTLKMGVVALKYLRDTKDVALFQSAQAVVLQMQLLPLSITMALFPMLSQLSVSSRDKLARVSSAALKYLFIASVPLAVIFYVFSSTIIGIIFGPDFAAASPVLSIMAWCIIPLFMSSLTEFILISMNRQQDVAKAWGLAFIVNAALNFFLIRIFGVKGAAIAVLVSFVLLSLFQYLFLSYRLEDMAFLKTMAARLFWPLALVIIFLSWFRMNGFYYQLLGAASAIVLFFAALFIVATISLSELKSFHKKLDNIRS